MIDEDKLENTAEQPTDTSEDKQVMTNEATAETMNSNAEGTENTQAEVTNQPTQATAAEENSAAAQTAQMTETDYQQVLSELTQQIESLKVQIEERNSQYVRIAADFDNFRKRSQKDKEDLEQQVKRNTILELLPVVDNFERARSQIKPQTEAEMSIHKSYQGVYKQMVDCLKRLGVSPMRPEGQEFDPGLHEAVMRQPTNEHPEGTVLEELVRGYFLGEGEARRVLRHAMVKVAAPEEIPEASTADPASAPE